MQLLISSIGFLAFKAETVQEYAASFYASITELFMLTTFFTLITKMGDIAKLTESFEQFIENSKSNKTLKFIFGSHFQF